MRHHHGQISRRIKKVALPGIERLELRCVLNSGSTLAPYPFALQDAKMAEKHPAVLASSQGNSTRFDHFSDVAGSGLKSADGRSNGSIPPIANVLPRINLSVYESLGKGSYLVPGSNYTLVIVVSPDIHAISVYAISSNEARGPDSVVDRGDRAVNLRPSSEFVQSVSPLVAEVKSSELASHAVRPEEAAPNIATTVIANALLHAGGHRIGLQPDSTAFTTVQSVAFAYDSALVQQVLDTIVLYHVPVVGDLFAVAVKVTTNFQQFAANVRLDLATPSYIVDWPVQKASFAAMQPDFEGLERSLGKVINELSRITTSMTTFLDVKHLTGAAVAATVIVGGGTAVYLRRSRSKGSRKHDSEEASSTWLFARLQSPRIHNE
jgi:hypothetical protein